LALSVSEDFLQARGLGRRPPYGDDWLLRDVELTVHGGQRLAIVGPSGSGKTLLLRALARLDPVDRGEVLWRGQAVVGNRVPDFRRQVIYLHQRPVLADGTAEDSLRAPFRLNAHRASRFDRDRIVNWLQLLGRDASLLARRQRELSGGEAQIVALLRAIQLQPQVLLLDEPTAALDADATSAVERLIDIWMQQQDAARATVWVSHDVQQAARVSTELLSIERGRLGGGGTS
jgi:putative ABC transport system ATP-binding protein